VRGTRLWSGALRGPSTWVVLGANSGWFVDRGAIVLQPEDTAPRTSAVAATIAVRIMRRARQASTQIPPLRAAERVFAGQHAWHIDMASRIPDNLLTKANLVGCRRIRYFCAPAHRPLFVQRLRQAAGMV
jgi:hypothetical protein